MPMVKVSNGGSSAITTINAKVDTNGSTTQTVNVPSGTAGIMLIVTYNVSSTVNSITGCTYTYLGKGAQGQLGCSEILVYSFKATSSSITVNHTTQGTYQSGLILLY